MILYILYTFWLLLQPLLELGSKPTFISSGLWMLPKQCDTICWYIAYSQILFCTFYLLLQPLLELGSKSTSLSSGFSDVIKAARYDLLIHCLISWSGFIPGNVERMDAIVRCGRCLAGGRGCLLKGPHLIPSLTFRLPYLINAINRLIPFCWKAGACNTVLRVNFIYLCLINVCGSLNCSFIMTYVMLTTFICGKLWMQSFINNNHESYLATMYFRG